MPPTALLPLLQDSDVDLVDAPAAEALTFGMLFDGEEPQPEDENDEDEE